MLFTACFKKCSLNENKERMLSKQTSELVSEWEGQVQIDK